MTRSWLLPTQRRQLGLMVLCLGTLVVAGCATSPGATGPGPQDFWEGRLGLIIDSQPPEQFFASFALRGHADQGELELSTPLGSQLALLQWQPGLAQLRQGDQTQHFTSMDDLLLAATGAAIPVAALFSWLHGQNTPVPGWQADLSRLADGRLSAQRSHPAPRAELRLILQQP